MTVYVLTQEPYHDTSSVLGVYASLEAAKVGTEHAYGHEWDSEGYYVTHWGATAQLDLGGDSLYLIRAFDLEGAAE
jgi:hypothetical protein